MIIEKPEENEPNLPEIQPPDHNETIVPPRPRFFFKPKIVKVTFAYYAFLLSVKILVEKMITVPLLGSK